MAYQGLSKYSISFPIFKVGEPWKLEMYWFCVGTGNTYSSKKGEFLSPATQNQEMAPIQQNCIARDSKIFN